MLRELFVQNLALIEDVRVELREGFCAWTGETGAGKTLLLEALGLLLGERGSTELIRTGADELRITGRFELSPPELRRQVEQILQTTLDDNEVILTRRLSRAGRSYAYANEQPVAVGTLRELGSVLVDIHGQRESQSLLEPAYQLELLDAYGRLHELRQNYLTAAEQVRKLRRRHADLAAERQHRQRELALLRFEREELDRAALRPGEMAELIRERERLVHTQALQAFAAEGCARLYDDEGSVVEQLGKLQREAESWAALDPAIAEVARRLQGLAAEVQDVAETLRSLGQRWEADPERLEAVDNRLQLLRRLETKYHRAIDDLIAYRATLEDQEAKLQQQEEDLAGVQEELARAFDRLRTAAVELSRQRHKVARRLAAETQRQLADLGMADARLDVNLEAIPLGDDPLTSEVPAWGIDQLELMLAANPGEPARPLRKVASGGELSRTMLALKTVLAEHDRTGTLVFDEIDANVGGRLGDVLGQKLAALGRTHQVICVTHLPQVASYARHHWTIRKVRRGKRTVTTIQLLGEAERLEELASMLRGEARGETTRQEAAAMLAAARADKKPAKGEDGKRGKGEQQTASSEEL
ncbi:MAG TPA: DNA repair protein RecN [Gemmataceae bacterium]|nr:DNA repair protein RecN [Gemmataceae bacterium]